MTKKSELSKHLAVLGRKGGKARVKNQTPEQRKQSARNAAQARWSERFVRSDINCKCGAKLRVEHLYVKAGFVSEGTATCPKCSKGHEVPTKILRVFIQNDDGVWSLIHDN